MYHILHRYRNDTGLFVGGPYFITFTLQTCEQAVIALASNISIRTNITKNIIWELAFQRINRPHSLSLRPCHCLRRERPYEIKSDNCNKPEDYWLAWSKNQARVGLGRYPGENEVEALILNSETRPTDLHVVVAQGRDMTANWTIYRRTNFTS